MKKVPVWDYSVLIWDNTVRLRLFHARTSLYFELGGNGLLWSLNYERIISIKKQTAVFVRVGGSIFGSQVKPGVGISDATVWIEDREDKSGSGLGLNLNMSLLYNFSKRGRFLTEVGYFTTWINFNNNDSEALGSFYLNLGYIYKFSRRSI